jgi:hypothetical protein
LHRAAGAVTLVGQSKPPFPAFRANLSGWRGSLAAGIEPLVAFESVYHRNPAAGGLRRGRAVVFAAFWRFFMLRVNWMSRALAVGAFAFSMMLAGAARAENNPAYESWAKHKPGTMVKIKTVSDAAGNKTEIEQTMTLKDVNPERVVIEVATSMSMMGQKMDQPAQTMEIKANEPAPASMTGKDTTDQPKPDMTTKEGEETVTVAGKSVKCKVTETTMKQGDMTVHTKVWMSPEIPGMLVKMENKTEGSVASMTTTEIVALELK